MSIQFTCDCGKSIRVKEELAGRTGRCPHCGAKLTIPAAPPKPRNADDEAGDFLLADSTNEQVISRPSPTSIKAADDKTAVRPGTPTTPAPSPEAARAAGPKAGSSLAKLFAPKKKKPPTGDEPKEWSGGIAIHPSILPGLAMMAGAAIWFFVGLAAGRIFFYPPILFCLGIAAIITGFRGS